MDEPAFCHDPHDPEIQRELDQDARSTADSRHHRAAKPAYAAVQHHSQPEHEEIQHVRGEVEFQQPGKVLRQKGRKNHRPEPPGHPARMIEAFCPGSPFLFVTVPAKFWQVNGGGSRGFPQVKGQRPQHHEQEGRNEQIGRGEDGIGSGNACREQVEGLPGHYPCQQIGDVPRFRRFDGSRAAYAPVEDHEPEVPAGANQGVVQRNVVSRGVFPHFPGEDSPEDEAQPPVEKGDCHGRNRHQQGCGSPVPDQGGDLPDDFLHGTAQNHHVAQYQYEHHLVGKDEQPRVPKPAFP